MGVDNRTRVAPAKRPPPLWELVGEAVYVYMLIVQPPSAHLALILVGCVLAVPLAFKLTVRLLLVDRWLRRQIDELDRRKRGFWTCAVCADTMLVKYKRCTSCYEPAPRAVQRSTVVAKLEVR